MARFQDLAEAQAAGVYISKIKSFVKREGRLTTAQARALEDNWPTMGLTVDMGRLNLAEVFGNTNPVILEIGFGMGEGNWMTRHSPQLFTILKLLFIPCVRTTETKPYLSLISARMANANWPISA